MPALIVFKGESLYRSILSEKFEVVSYRLAAESPRWPPFESQQQGVGGGLPVMVISSALFMLLCA
jgi:hypothetical protein